MTLTKQTVAYLEVPVEEAERLRDMPTLVTNYAWGKLDGTYILPPIKYPDGKWYLKLGHHEAMESMVESKADMIIWFQDGQGDPEAVSQLSSFVIDHFIPSIKVTAILGGCCITSNVSQ